MFKSKKKEKFKKVTSKICVIMFILSCISTFFVSQVLAENETNLIINGDFETTTDTTSWTTDQGNNKATIGLDSKVFSSTSGSAHSIKIQGTGVSAAGMTQTVAIKAGKQYSFAALLKCENVTKENSTSDGLGAFVIAYQLDSSKNVIGSTAMKYNKYDSTDNWTGVGGDFVADSNAAYFMVLIGLDGSGTVWFDDVTLAELGSTPTKGNVKRLSGTSRVDTSLAIAKEQAGTQALDAVVLTTAFNFPDALSGVNIAYNNNAPILLVNKTVSDSKSTLDYINANLPQGKTVYILGGEGVVSKEIASYLQSKYTIVRLSGSNRYETNQAIFNKLNVQKGTPIVIATGDSFADALSISSIAAMKGYPILLNSKDNLLSNVKTDIANIQPTTVYIVGGPSVISDNIKNQISSISASTQVVRLAGTSRYETSKAIVKQFQTGADNIVLATGADFPDALSGAFLAAKKNAGILLIDNNNVTADQKSIVKASKSVYVLGAEGALKSSTVTALTQ